MILFATGFVVRAGSGRGTGGGGIARASWAFLSFWVEAASLRGESFFARGEVLFAGSWGGDNESAVGEDPTAESLGGEEL